MVYRIKGTKGETVFENWDYAIKQSDTSNKFDKQERWYCTI